MVVSQRHSAMAPQLLFSHAMVSLSVSSGLRGWNPRSLCAADQSATVGQEMTRLFTCYHQSCTSPPFAMTQMDLVHATKPRLSQAKPSQVGRDRPPHMP